MWGRAVALTLAAAVAAAVATLPCIGEAEVFAGDAKVADSLLKSGKQALSKGDHAGAVAFFRKAFEESPELIEACCLRATALEKGGDKAGALATYREYLGLFNDKAATGASMSKEELRLKAQAEKAIEHLAAGEKEFRKLEDAYVAALLSFAKENFVRDPGVSRKAVDAILALRPDHEQALALAEKLGGGGGGAAAVRQGPKPPTGPFAAVTAWRDLISDRSFQTDHITFEDGAMVLDMQKGKVCHSPGYIDCGTSFAYEVEFRIVATYEGEWTSGLGFAWNSNDFVGALACPTKVVLTHFLPNGKFEDLVTHERETIQPNTWHRIGVLVKGPSAEVWFDGAKVMSWRQPSGQDLSGDVVIMNQRCRAEWRLLHIGKVQ